MARKVTPTLRLIRQIVKVRRIFHNTKSILAKKILQQECASLMREVKHLEDEVYATTKNK